MSEPAAGPGLSHNHTPETPNLIPAWQNCVECEDLGIACNGPSIRTLGGISSARAYHKALRFYRGIPLKEIVRVARDKISEASVNEYFSNVAHDFKWTTVFVIDDALVSIIGDRVGKPPLTNACPASSAEMRAHMAAADIKLAAAELRAAKLENTVADLQTQVIDVKARCAERIDQIQADHTRSMEWLKRDVALWRRFAFVLLLMAIVMLIYHVH